MLIIGNLLPIIGVLFFQWSIFAILIIFWFESLIIGMFNVIKIFMSGFLRPSDMKGMQIVGAFFFSGFFTFHYGIFMFVHLMFLIFLGKEFNMIGVSFDGNLGTIGGGILENVGYLVSKTFSGPLELLNSPVLCVLLILVYNGIYFASGFVRKKEYLRKGMTVLMGEPYGRIVVMHMTIIIGFFVTSLFPDQSWIIVIFIALKTLFDVRGMRKLEKAGM